MEPDTDEPKWAKPQNGRARSRLGPKEILTPKQYRDYQHGRILSVLFVFFGCTWALVGVAQLLAPTADAGKEPLSWEVWCGFVVVGLCGVTGGAAGFLGSRAWSRFGFVFAAAFVFACGPGTAIAFLWLLGRSRHMAACDRIRKARTENG